MTIDKSLHQLASALFGPRDEAPLRHALSRSSASRVEAELRAGRSQAGAWERGNRVGSFILAVILSCASARAADAITPADPALGRPVDFNLDVYPILESKCLACHSRTMHEGDLVLEGVEQLLKGGSSGPAAVAGKPDESLIVKVTARLEEPFMPPQPNKAAAMPLTPRELGVLRKWIEEGAQPGKANPASAGVAWQTIPAGIKSIYSLDLSADDRFVAVGRANRIVVYDLLAKQEVAQLVDPALRAVQKADGTPLYDAGVAHLDFVHALAFSPNGDWLASSGFREIKLWQRQRDVKLLQQALGAPINALAINADGTQAAFILNGIQIRLWNLASGQPGPTIQGFPAVVNTLAFTPNGESLLVGSEDSTLSLWKLADGQQTLLWNVAQPVKSVAITNDGKALSGHADGKLRLWDIPATKPEAPLQPLKELANHGGPILSIQTRPGANEVVTGCADGQIRRVNLDNGNVEFANGPGGPVPAAAISANGEVLAAAATTANLARAWKRDGQQIAELKSDPVLGRIAGDLADEVTVVKSQAALADAASKQAEKDVTERDDSLKKANEAKTKATEALAEPEKKATEAEAAVKTAKDALAAKPDDEGLKKQVEEAEKNLKKAQEDVQKAKDAITSADRAIQLSQQSLDAAKKSVEDRKMQLTAAQQRVTDIEAKQNTAKQVSDQSAKPTSAVAISPDGKQIATGGDDGLIHLWDAATGRWAESLHGHTGPVRHLSYSPSGALVSAADDQSFILWEVKPQWKLAAVLGGKPENTVDVTASPMVDRVLCLAFSPDSTRLASGGGDPSRSGEVILWDVASRGVIRTLPDLHSDTVFGLDFSRDGTKLASCAADKFVKVTDVETGKLQRAYEGHTSHVLSVAWKQDGSSLVSSGADNAIKIWNVETGEQRRTISNYGKQVTAVDYIGVSDSLVSCSGDTAVKFHNAGNGGNYRTFGGSSDYVYGVAASRDESIVVAAGEDGVVRVWNGKDGKLLIDFPPPSPAGQATTAAR